MFSASAGAESSSSGSRTKKAAAPGARSARWEMRTQAPPAWARRTDQRLTFVPSTASAAGIARTATATAASAATMTPIPEETSSDPGATSMPHAIPRISAAPARTTVRPARTAASSAAWATLRPSASSSRKRETTSSA